MGLTEDKLGLRYQVQWGPVPSVFAADDSLFR